MRDLMVDLETTHTLPDRGAIIQVAAVEFDLENRAVGKWFDRALLIPPTRAWSEDTRSWWMKQNREVLQGIWNRMEDPFMVMKDFVEWCQPTNSYRFWSKPSHFDFNFVASYCHDMQLANPFDFRKATDLRSYLLGLHAPNPVPDLKIDFSGDQHNALHDCFHQIKMLFAHADTANPSGLASR